MFKDKNAVSQVLAAMMMIFLFTAAIGVVWGYLYPAYRRFQTTNTINSVTSYMLSIDESIYDIYGEGEGTTKAMYVDPSFGTFLYENGKNVSLQYTNTAGTFTGSYTFDELGMLSYTLENRRGVMLDIGDADVVLAPITTTPRTGQGDYELQTWQSCGLLRKSWIRLAKVSCLPKNLVSRLLGNLLDTDLENVMKIWQNLYPQKH